MRLIPFLGVVVLVACGTSSPSQDDAPFQVGVRVTATDLFGAYDDNAVVADARYKGQWLDVSGVIDSIGANILDTPSVTFDVGDAQAWGVQAMFMRDKDEGLVATFTKGQALTLRCRGAGKLLNVIVERCSIVP